MSYVLTLNDEHSQRLEVLARDEQLPTLELIEKIILEYLDSTHPVPAGRDLGTAKDLYTWDEERGIVRFVPANKRVFIVTARSWDMVEEELFVKLLRRASSLLTEMGGAYGKATTLDYRSAAANPEELTAYLEHLGRTAGWGKFVVQGDFKGPKITVRIWDCVFCRGRSMSVGRTDPCYFLMGTCKGIADTVYDSMHYVEETKCCARGNEYCEIIIRKASESQGSVWQMGSGAPADTSMR